MGYHAKTGVISHPQVNPMELCLKHRSAGSSFWNLALWVGTLLWCFGSVAVGQSVPLSAVTPKAERVLLSTTLRVQLRAQGGTAPYMWRLMNVELPKGLSLDKVTGLVSGVPQVAGEFKIPVAVDDSGVPRQESTTELYITIISQLEVQWKQPPQIRNDGISGSVVVTNNTNRRLQLTVIVLALNTIDKAFALGYQHFDLTPNAESPLIPFGSALPFGSYTVNVDAIAEEPAARHIFRSRLESNRRLILQQRP